MQPQVFTLDEMRCPLGTMLIATDARSRVRTLDWSDHEARMHRLIRQQYSDATVQLVKGRMPPRVRDALEAYFAGGLQALGALELETGGTAFQREVWAALRSIPAGQTRSYGELAKQLRRPSAYRAVGLANGANPIGIIVPCHRVIGANATLTGYAAGLQRKRWLLEHEGATGAAHRATAP